MVAVSREFRYTAPMRSPCWSTHSFLAIAATLGCAALATFPGCKNAAPVDAKGTIVLSVSSDRTVDRIQLRAFSPSGEVADIEFDAKNQDLTQKPISGEVTPGMAVPGGSVMFVGFGLLNGQVVAAGRVATAFENNKKTAAALALVGGVVDTDRDGYAATEECDDNNSKRNPFFTERCDNELDDDCDGSVNESCPCEAGSKRRCYDGDETTRGKGECADGEQQCVAGVWGECQGAIVPRTQLCSGRDDDCDGSVDEGCPCTAGTQRFCYQTRFTTVGGSASEFGLKGECRAGVQQCQQAQWGLCTGANYPVSELCDGLDNDCDDVFDNGFDLDGDTYTTCGTNHSGCPGPLVGGGVNPQFADCDDGRADRHPCQADRCDTLDDLDCSGSAFVCVDTGKGTCASQGYFGGFVPGTDQCRFLAGSFGESCTVGGLTCVDAAGEDCVASNGQASTGPTFARATCRTPVGCDAGTQTPPANGANITSGDPFNDCGNQVCNGTGANRVFAGVGGSERSGWRYVGTGASATFQCHVYSGANSNCEGDGTCEEPHEACQRANGATEQVTATGGVAADKLNVGACKQPTGATYSDTVVVSTTDILAASCVTSTTGTNTNPLVADVGNNLRDPGRRCPAMSTCTSIVKTAFAAPQSGQSASCVQFAATQGARGEFACNGSGACKDAGTNGCNLNDSGTTTTCTDSRCANASACVVGSAVGSRLCLNTNGAGAAEAGACPAGERCYNATPNGNAASCQICNQTNRCGDRCVQCSGAQVSCCDGFNDTSNCLGTSANSADFACSCTQKTGLTLHQLCNGACCPNATDRCDIAVGPGTCAATPGGAIPCGTTTCTAATQWCNTADVPFVCAAAAQGRPCNQRDCGTGEYCSSALSSTCSVCDQQTACGNACDVCAAGTQVCRAANKSACDGDAASCGCRAVTGHEDNCCGSSCAICQGGNVCKDSGGGSCTNGEANCSCQAP